MRIKLGSTKINATYMKERKLLLIALFCGILAAAANIYFLTSTAGKSKTILKAKKDLQAGSTVTRDDFTEFEIRSTEQDFKGIFVEKSDFDAFDNKSIVVSLRKDDPLLIQAFDPSQSVVVPAGKRLVPIRVQDEEQAIGYLIRNGRQVDLYGWIHGTQYKLASSLCVAATGSLSYTPRTEGGHEIRYSSISVIIDEKDIMNLQQNLHLALDSIRISLSGHCDPAITPFIEKAIPPPTPLPGVDKIKLPVYQK